MARRARLLYLDQHDLSNIINERVPADVIRDLNQLIADGRLTLVISRTHAFETARAQDEAFRMRIADFADGIPNKLWLLFTSEITKAEVAYCLNVGLGYANVSRPWPFTRSILEYCSRVPNCDTSGWDESREFRGLVGFFLRDRSPELHRPVDEWPAFLAFVRTLGPYTTPTEDDQRKALAQHMPDRTPAGLFIAKGAFEWSVDLGKCPASTLVAEMMDVVKRTPGAKAKPSDMPDLNHIMAIPYCDMTTLDGQMHGLVLQTSSGKLYHDRIALNVAEALDKLGLSSASARTESG